LFVDTGLHPGLEFAVCLGAPAVPAHLAMMLEHPNEKACAFAVLRPGETVTFEQMLEFLNSLPRMESMSRGYRH